MKRNNTDCMYCVSEINNNNCLTCDDRSNFVPAVIEMNGVSYRAEAKQFATLTMNMPHSCSECMLSYMKERKREFICTLLDENVSDCRSKRYSGCPLKEEVN